MKNQAGQATIDFIFALVIGVGMSIILFAMTFTLSAIEVTQYITFAAARSHSAGNHDPDAQKDSAKRKYSQLAFANNSALSFLYRSEGYFRISPCAAAGGCSLDIRSGILVDSNFSDDLGSGLDLRRVYTGVSTQFQSKMLDLKLPLIGKTNPDDPSNGFKTNVNTILIREPTWTECTKFWREDRRANLGDVLSGDGPARFYKNTEYFSAEDNGC